MDDPTLLKPDVPTRAMIVMARGLERLSGLLEDPVAPAPEITATANAVIAGAAAHDEADDYYDRRDRDRAFADAIEQRIMWLSEDRLIGKPFDARNDLRSIVTLLRGGDDQEALKAEGLLPTDWQPKR